MADESAYTGEALVVITNADVYIKESAIAQQLRDTGIEFSRVIKKRGSQRAFVFFRAADSLEQAATLIRMLKAPISQQLYTCDVVMYGSVPTLPDTVITLGPQWNHACALVTSIHLGHLAFDCVPY